MMNGYEYTGMNAILAGSFRAAIYCRLSKDDDLDGESASIANQRDMLEHYCEKQGWEVVAVYQDDGYTGLNMERPDLKRMIKAIERRQVNLVITKDLSRLGRNYLQTGYLIEDFFPRNGVRYIAMNDGIDTLRENNDIAPFKNILNEMYSKDISKKVHSSYLLKAQKGEFTGCVAPFGYRKDPEDKNHLLVDEETAPIVRQIFRWALEGHGPNFIRRRLEEQKVPCPTWWNRERGIRNVRTKWEKQDPINGRCMWDFSVIKDILMNPVYAGAIASQKKDYRFKIGTIGEKKPQDWIVVEQRHEPLIDCKSFAIVQDTRKFHTERPAIGRHGKRTDFLHIRFLKNARPHNAVRFIHRFTAGLLHNTFPVGSMIGIEWKFAFPCQKIVSDVLRDRFCILTEHQHPIGIKAQISCLRIQCQNSNVCHSSPPQGSGADVLPFLLSVCLWLTRLIVLAITSSRTLTLP